MPVVSTLSNRTATLMGVGVDMFGTVDDVQYKVYNTVITVA